MHVQEIFPTPLAVDQYFDAVKIDVSDIDTTAIVGNFVSTNNYILDLDRFADIKMWIDKKVLDYYKKVCGASNVKPYITQSWLNFTNENQYHHLHQHPNSIVSGVFYINVDDNDSIIFSKPNTGQLSFDIKYFNQFNSQQYITNVKNGMLLLFPSNLLHRVDTKNSNGTRISLAFNTFIKGKLGSQDGLDYLEIN